MKAFVCDHCKRPVYFENIICLNCRHHLGWDSDTQRIVALEATGEATYRPVAGQPGQTFAYCSNSRLGVCNWLVSGHDADALCVACALNRTIPNLQEDNGLSAWAQLEAAKKRLVYSLQRFRLPRHSPVTGKGLTFDFVRDAATGHLDGVVTIDIGEADSVQRERQRQLFGEPYRSLLGHLRHESGHFYWHLLIEERNDLERFRNLFGDERADYAAAIANHHANGPPPGWETRHVSAYASAHPWEDWAETWAHYLHMVETLETAATQGMEPRAAGLAFGARWPFRLLDVYREETFDAIVERWLPLAGALNCINRSMGHHDFYPFVVPAIGYDKMRMVHDVIRGQS